MLILEDLGLDVLIIFAGWLGVVPLAVHSALIESYVLGFMACLGISESSTTRVGNLLGSGHISRAKLSFAISTVICVAFEVVFAAILFLGRALFARAYCPDHDVIEQFKKLFPVVCVVSVEPHFKQWTKFFPPPFWCLSNPACIISDH